MKNLLTSIIFLFISCSYLIGQIDISESLADPRSFKFDNLEIDVYQYLDSVLTLDTTCCVDANFIMKVQFDRTGTVTLAEPLTTAKTCAIKIITGDIYGIRWDAPQGIDSKTIYLEINHTAQCK